MLEEVPLPLFQRRTLYFFKSVYIYLILRHSYLRAMKSGLVKVEQGVMAQFSITMHFKDLTGPSTNVSHPKISQVH